jgi:hypothetical protein
MLTENTFASWIRASVVECEAIHTRTVGGSRDNDVAELTVTPKSVPAEWVVTTVTPEGRLPMTSL